TIFVGIQTNEMSADGINKMATHRPKKIPLKRKNLHIQNLIAAQKGLEGSLRGTFPQKVPLKN
ncbi:MAG: hypothetical protein J6C42_05595, partial [Clostridia bacterium]|nr:hypothetical protein [Clostridia bacterium]